MVKFCKKWENEEDRRKNERDFIQHLRELGYKIVTNTRDDDEFVGLYSVYTLDRE